MDKTQEKYLIYWKIILSTVRQMVLQILKYGVRIILTISMKIN